MHRVASDVTVRLRGSYLTVIEQGFLTDLMSWPFERLLRRVLPQWFTREKFEKYKTAAVIHDHLIKTTDWPKWQVDELFHIALRASSVSALEAMIFKLAVRTKRKR